MKENYSDNFKEPGMPSDRGAYKNEREEEVLPLSLTEDDLPESYRKQRMAENEIVLPGEQSSMHSDDPQDFDKQKVSRKRKSSGSVWPILLCLLVVGLAGAGGYKIIELQRTLTDSQALLTNMGSNLKEVTGVVSQTGEVLNASDSKVKAELKSINFEIRKLWDLSNKRNKSDIVMLQDKLKQYDDQIKSLKGNLAAAAQQVKKVEMRASKMEKEANTVAQQVKSIGVEQSITVGTLKEELLGFSKKLNVLSGKVGKALVGDGQTNKELRELNEGLKSIDTYRQQINRRLIQVESSIRDLQALTEKK